MNVREIRRVNQKWECQKHRKQLAQNTERRQTNKQSDKKNPQKTKKVEQHGPHKNPGVGGYNTGAREL